MKISTIVTVVTTAAASPALAASVTPDIIFGSGNGNGGFTVSTLNRNSGTVELGLRAKLRYDEDGEPQDTFNYDGVDTYSFSLADKDVPADRSVFNYEWSINVSDLFGDIQGLRDTYDLEAVLRYDIDPTAGTTFTSYNLFDFDAYYGTNATGNGGGTYDKTGTPVSGATVAQNSVNYGFLLGAPLTAGIFDIELDIVNSRNGESLGSTAIAVNVANVPLPAGLPLLLAGLGGLGLVARKRQKA